MFWFLQYSMLHLTPPMSAPDELRQCKKLVNEAGYLEVNNETLQSTRYPNIFSIGDCSSAPTSKTAAAVGGYTLIQCIMFVCLLFSVHLRICHSYGDVTIASDML